MVSGFADYAMADRPFLSAAFLCEKVLVEKDDVLTPVRIVDSLSVSIPPNIPADAKPAIQLTGLLSFKKSSKSSDAEKHQTGLRIRTPSGKYHPDSVHDFFFKPDELAGANLIVSMTLAVEEFGLFWIEVSVDGERVTQIPFRLLQAAIAPAKTIH